MLNRKKKLDYELLVKVKKYCPNCNAIIFDEKPTLCANCFTSLMSVKK